MHDHFSAYLRLVIGFEGFINPSHSLGTPQGVVNMVVTPNEAFSETVHNSKDVRKLTFTGFTEVGKLFNETKRRS
ncbi:aldehyde dehydrogenase family protein [Halobacillus sp. K22]|uniref:aldehyde dehydrogenase family protein n=1 Tax=Halobacillus sp. K22 TaxID=3457431 RepID=UPI003FCC811D